MMGHFAELTAEKYNFSRKDQDDFAIASVTRARAAAKEGRFDNEIAPVTVKARKGETEVSKDEGPEKANIEKIPTLKPAFKDDGTVTAASSSSISDGAATLILMRESDAKERGVKILARIAGHSSFAQEPEWFTTSPLFAIEI